MLDLIIRGGRVVTSDGVGDLDVGVLDGQIAAVATPGTLEVETRRTIDASGKIVLPGGIEPHAHIGIPVPEVWAGRSEVITQPPEGATRAAAFGGVTTCSTSPETWLSPQAMSLPPNRSWRKSRAGATLSPGIPTPILLSISSWPGPYLPVSSGRLARRYSLG